MQAEDTVVYEGELLVADTEFEYRDSALISGNPSSLSSDPEEILTVIDDPRNGEKEGERRLYTVTDFHAVFPFPLEEIIPVFTSFDEEHTVYDRIVYTKDLSPEASAMEPHFQEVKTAFRFLGIGTQQHYILYKVPERISEDEFIIKWNMTESVDGKFYKYYGSWYLKRLSPAEGSSEPRTYIRNYATIGFIEPPRGLKMVYNLFLGKEIGNFFSDVYDAVKADVE